MYSQSRRQSLGSIVASHGGDVCGLDAVKSEGDIHGSEGDDVWWVEEGDVCAVRVGDDEPTSQNSLSGKY